MAPPTGLIPPELPPSVEEAYRAKCIQLKQRLSEVEEANDTARLRIARINRGIQKSRLERAFLLEQLAKRTSTNVEDSEGSPSPPPTPKEKPLRTKRGHRKPDFMSADVGDGRSGNIFIRQGPATMSPCSDTFSHTHPESHQTTTPQVQSQISKRLPKNNETPIVPAHNTESVQSQNNYPKSAADLHCNEARPRTLNENGKEISDNSCDLDATPIKEWNIKDSSRKNDHRKSETVKNSIDVSEQDMSGGGLTRKNYGGRLPVEETGDEDIEMQDSFDTPTAAKPEITGFTPVNRG